MILIRIHIFTDRCHGYELVLGIGWRKHDVWVGWPGFGTMSIRKTEKVFNHNYKQPKNNNLKMQTYLDQLPEQVRLKQLGLKEQKKQPSGLPSIYDHIDTN